MDNQEFLALYTTTEGGEWIPYKGLYACLPNEDVLQDAIRVRKTDGTTEVLGVNLHSFLTSEGRRWDALSGWTVPTEGSKDEIPQAKVQDPS